MKSTFSSVSAPPNVQVIGSNVTLGGAALAADAGLPDNGGFGGIALAYNARSRSEVDLLVPIL